LGVDFFFVISGFLIAYLLLSEKELEKTINIRAFYFRRILRIFPLYYLLVLISFILFSWRSSIHINYWAQLFFWGNFEVIRQQDWPGGFLTVLWTLCVEEHFYLVIPFLIFLVPIKHVKWIFLGVVIISIASKIYFVEHYQAYWFHINCHTLSKMDVIALGGLLATIQFENRFRFRLSPLIVVLSLGIIVFLMSTISFVDYTGFTNAVFKRYLVIIPFIFFFSVYVFNDHPFLTGIKKNVFINYLGSISYGVYMYHSIVLFCIKPWMNDQTVLQKIALAFATAVATIVIAAISYHYLEKPFLRLKGKLETIKTESGEVSV